MLTIGNFTASQLIQRNMSNQIKEITESSERLSSGKRVNKSSDDPSSIGQISRINAEIISIGKALQNGADGKIVTQLIQKTVTQTAPAIISFILFSVFN